MEVQNRFRVFHDSEDLALALALDLTKLIHKYVSERGICHMVFPGGRSPRRILELLRVHDVPWGALHLYPSDERCVPVRNLERNDRLIDELLLPTQVPLPPENLHRIPAELGPEEGAQLYSQLLDKTECFNIALLGVGVDGHTASLFPGNPALNDIHPAVPVHNAPKPPSERVSIGLTRLRGARERWVIITGAEKQDVINRIQRGDDLPVTRIKPTAWFVDTVLVNLAEERE